MKMTYRAIVVDLVPGVDDDKRADECSSEGVADTIEQAITDALEGSAVNCNRRVYVTEEDEPFRTVKGPYIIKAVAR